MTTLTTDTHLSTFDVETLMTKAFELTHRLHELAPYNGTGPGARSIAQAREERDAIVREMQRRSEGMERALVVVEAAERVMRGADGVLANAAFTADPEVNANVAHVREALDMMMERTTTLTCSLVKDQTISDRISAKAREVVRPIRDRAREVAASVRAAK